MPPVSPKWYKILSFGNRSIATERLKQKQKNTTSYSMLQCMIAKYCLQVSLNSHINFCCVRCFRRSLLHFWVVCQHRSLNRKTLVTPAEAGTGASPVCRPKSSQVAGSASSDMDSLRSEKPTMAEKESDDTSWNYINKNIETMQDKRNKLHKSCRQL